MSRPVFAFDLNGTLLDLSALDPHFQRLFGKNVRREWFRQTIHHAMACTLTGYYYPFPQIAEAALYDIAERHGRSLSDAEVEEVMASARELPVFHDVKPGLDSLKKQGYRLAVLTNSPEEAADSVLTKAGVRDYFEQVLSADSIREYKPCPTVYRMAAQQLGIEPSLLTLVAAHSWDTTGAIRAGCDAIFLARPGEFLDALAPKPSIIAADLQDLADKLVRAKAA